MKSNTTEATDSIVTRRFFYTFLSVICNQKYRPEKRSISKKCKSYGKETLPEDMDHRKSRNLTKRIILGRDDA